MPHALSSLRLLFVFVILHFAFRRFRERPLVSGNAVAGCLKSTSAEDRRDGDPWRTNMAVAAQQPGI
jgi:hypothetical protein